MSERVRGGRQERRAVEQAWPRPLPVHLQIVPGLAYERSSRLSAAEPLRSRMADTAPDRSLALAQAVLRRGVGAGGLGSRLAPARRPGRGCGRLGRARLGTPVLHPRSGQGDSQRQ